MVFCGNCGEQITGNVKFCPNCGAALNNSEPVRPEPANNGAVPYTAPMQYGSQTQNTGNIPAQDPCPPGGQAAHVPPTRQAADIPPMGRTAEIPPVDQTMEIPPVGQSVYIPPEGQAPAGAVYEEAPKEKKPGSKKPFIFIGIGVAVVAIVAVILFLVLGRDKGTDVTGKYICTCSGYGDEFGYEEPEDEWIELKKGGKGIYYTSFEFDMEWELDGEAFSATVTFLGMEQAMTGTLKDGVIEVRYGDLHMFFVKEGMPVPDYAKPEANQETTEETESEPETTAAPVETEPVTSGVADGPYAWWSGDWYGWWVIRNGGGQFEDWVDSWWDACATIEVYDDSTGFIFLWDDSNEAGESFCYADVTFGAGTTENGCMMSESGNFMGSDFGHADWIVDPGASIVSQFENTICIDGEYVDPDNADDWFDYYIILRPWGTEWEDIRNADTTNLPYDDMMPLSYDSWYLPLIRSGVTKAPESFGETEPGAPVTEGGEPFQGRPADILDYNDHGKIFFTYPMDTLTYDEFWGTLENEDSSLVMYFTADSTEEQREMQFEKFDSAASVYENYKKEELTIGGYDAVRMSYMDMGDYYVDTYISFGDNWDTFSGIYISVRSYNSLEECTCDDVEDTIRSIQVR